MEEENSIKIKVYPLKKMIDILKTAADLPPCYKKVLNIICGPTGSGKSTIMANLYKNKIIDVPFINTMLLKLQGSNSSLENIINEKITQGLGIAFEWDSSSPEILDIIKFAKEHGYKIKTYFVYTTSAYINEKRANIRYKQGGEYYERDEIEENFKLTLPLAKLLQKESDVFELINSTFIEDSKYPIQ